MRRRRVQFELGAADEGGVNMTPLIDVVFVVLILFILVSPMLEIDKVKLASGPAREQKETVSPGSLLIHVHENNSISINKRKVQEDNLRPILQALYTKDPKLTPQLYQDEKAYFGTYQKVKNAIEEAGFEQLDVVLEPGK